MNASLVAAGPHTFGGAGVGDPWAFHLHLFAWLAIALLALAYALAVRHLGMRSGPRTLSTRRQLRCLAGALVALVLALTWPLADLAAHWSLTALVVQRLLLTLGAAPLLLLAIPTPLLATLTRPAPLDACLETLTRPVVAVVTFTVVAVGTLVTPAVAAQASSPWWRALTDLALLLAGAVLWGPVLRHIPGAHRTVPVGVAAYLFIQSVIPTFPAIIYVFARHPLYETFSNVRVAFGISRLVDQQLAGVVAKVATLPVLWSAAWVALDARPARRERGGRRRRRRAPHVGRGRAPARARGAGRGQGAHPGAAAPSVGDRPAHCTVGRPGRAEPDRGHRLTRPLRRPREPARGAHRG